MTLPYAADILNAQAYSHHDMPASAPHPGHAMFALATKRAANGAMRCAPLAAPARYDIYFSIASIVPAATAVPMTPATFGPMACMSR